jgi:hypothetical protein
MQLLRDTLWEIHPTGTITGAGGDPGSRVVGRMPERGTGKRNETRLDRPLSRPIHCVGRNLVGIRARNTFAHLDRNEPAGWGCDEGPVTDQSATNARGDVVEEYIKVCTAVGSFADYSILLQLHGGEKAAMLAERSDPQQGYPKFHWQSNGTLMIDLGKVTWIRSPVHKVAGVDITYVYSMGE